MLLQMTATHTAEKYQLQRPQTSLATGDIHALSIYVASFLTISGWWYPTSEKYESQLDYYPQYMEK